MTSPVRHRSGVCVQTTTGSGPNGSGHDFFRAAAISVEKPFSYALRMKKNDGNFFATKAARVVFTFLGAEKS